MILRRDLVITATLSLARRHLHNLRPHVAMKNLNRAAPERQPQVATSERKRLGMFYTPPDLARFLVDWAVRAGDDRVLDPACGAAVFLIEAEKRLKALGGHVGPGSLIGYEIDGNAVAFATQQARSAEVTGADFFECEPNDRKFDAVVGNPPYVRYHYFKGTGRRRAIERATALGVKLPDLTSSWAPFVVHAASFLKPDGRLAFVVPAELLSTDYAEPIRQYLESRFASVRVLTFESRVFPGAMVDVVLLMAEGEGPGAISVHRLSHWDDFHRAVDPGMPATPGGKWTKALLSASTINAFEHATGEMVWLGSIASVDIGVVTGANDFFVMAEPARRELNLDEIVVKPLLARSMYATSHQIGRDSWEMLRASGAPVWLFTPDNRAGPVGNYIDAGEERGINKAYKCRVRKPWWKLKLPSPPDLILSYMSNYAPRLIANAGRVLTTNLLHNVRLTEELDPSALALAWNNSATFLSAELAGRAYGGGVLKLETKEAERVWVPRLNGEMVADLKARSMAVDVLIAAGMWEAVADLVDPIVLAALSPADRAAVRAGWQDLRCRRQRRTRAARAAVSLAAG